MWEYHAAILYKGKIIDCCQTYTQNDVIEPRLNSNNPKYDQEEDKRRDEVAKDGNEDEIKD